jgi:hypothetical protein
MDFDVRCDCGEYVTVSEGTAGARVPCPCGRTVAVPSLADLRRQAGLAAYRPKSNLVIENMLALGELPTRKTCVGCTDATHETLDVTAECEKAWNNEPGILTWIITFLFLGWLGALVLSKREGREHGANLILHLPVRMCRSCQKLLLRNPLGLILDLSAIVLAVAGVLIMVFGTIWGGILLLGSVLALCAEIIVRKQRQATIKMLLALEPIYEQLLDDYPKANLVWNTPRRSG